MCKWLMYNFINDKLEHEMVHFKIFMKAGTG